MNYAFNKACAFFGSCFSSMLVDTFLLINKKIIVKAKNDIILIKIERLRAYCDVIPKTRNVKKLICPTL